MTLNFWRMCTANLLLFISVYMLFPLLPFVMGEQLGVSVGQAGSMFLVFAVAMFTVGPFHAYLVDEYKRKHVLLYSALIMLGWQILRSAIPSGCGYGLLPSWYGGRGK